MADAAIKVSDLTIAYDGTPIIENLTFSIPGDAITMIIGPNGAGKTTLLRALLGLATPTQGSVTVLGHTPAAIRSRVGYVPQRFQFDRTIPLTVREFIAYSCPSCSQKRLEHVLEHLGVANVLSQRLGTLSGGQLQRLLIARALLPEPQVLYLDEPVSGVDVEGGQTFYDLVSEINREQDITIVMVSHELDVIKHFADHVVCLNRTLVCSGGPREALTPETIRALYGDDTDLYRHQHTH